MDEIQTINPQQQQQLTSKSSKEQSSSTSQSQAVQSKAPLKKSQVDSKKLSNSARSIQMSSSTGQIASFASASASVKAVKESNYTASISSIGSNVLRSKTADFERMSDSNKKSRISAANFPALQTSHNVQSLQAKIQSPPIPNVTNISISLKTTAAPKKKSVVEEPSVAATGVEKRSMPIYKRQEIISSVQKTVKK